MVTRIVLIVLLLVNVACSQDKSIITYKVDGVQNPLIKLNGSWELCLNPSDHFWNDTISKNGWHEILVPGEIAMQGFAVKHDQPFLYRTEVMIPEDFKGKEIKLQFDGVYSYGKLWVNGNFVRDHYGGFTRWDCDITQYVDPGKKAWIILEVTDKADDISYASGYAKHQIGGILRDVCLMALPENYPEKIFIETNLDENYQNAVLSLSGNLKSNNGNNKIEIKLKDPENVKVDLENSTLILNNEKIFSFPFPVNNPGKWDSEHPKLYNLSVLFYQNDKLLWQRMYKIGFREIEIKGNKFLVNGEVIKLRGANRHDIHPILGRVSTPEYELMDVQIAKEANINFIRTSHYPPTESFLQLCDEYGIYVEDESAVCFVGSHRTKEYYPGNSENDSSFTARYKSQLSEMVYSHWNHPSVIFWSIGNENRYGMNFKKSYDWVKATDPTRPVIFSYPGLVPDGITAYDLLSMHYPDHKGNLNQYGKQLEEFQSDKIPAINDEWAHVACYNKYTLKEDPNVRDFWGRSLDSMWVRVFDAEGGLGGAIWGMIDETFMLPDTLSGYDNWWGKNDEKILPLPYAGNCVGYGEWGIVDTWRRKKPEFWNTKKAYSPVKIQQTEFNNIPKDKKLKIPVYNRFNHTNFNELQITWEYNGITQTLESIDLNPHETGIIIIPIEKWSSGEKIKVSFYTSQRLIDSYSLSLINGDTNKRQSQDLDYSELLIEENELSLKIENDILEVSFNKETGLINNISNQYGKIIDSGPYLTLRTKGESIVYSSSRINNYAQMWKLKSLKHRINDGVATINLSGSYSDTLNVEYEIIISPDGNMLTKYNVTKLPEEFIRELGIRYVINNSASSVSWNRNSYWSYYPKGHLSAQAGEAFLYSDTKNRYRHKPQKEYEYDIKSFYYDSSDDEVDNNGLTYISKSTKENINNYTLHFNNSENKFSVLSEGKLACRLEKKDKQIFLYINSIWDYVNLAWGNYQNNIIAPKKFSAEISMSISGGNKKN